MASRSNVVILGGGVIGLTTAYLLARMGKPSIVLDQGELGKEASWAGAGILPHSDPATAQTPLEQLRALSVSQFAGLSAELRERTGIDNGYRKCGGLEIPVGQAFQPAEPAPTCESGHDSDPMAGWKACPTDADEWGCGGEPIDAPSTLEPALAPRLGPARHLPDMAQVRNPRHMQALVAGCATFIGADGWPLVDLRPGVGVTSLLRDGNRIDAVGTTHGVVEGDRFLVAAGAWTAQVLRPLGFALPVTPVRGQMLLLNPGPPLLRRILLCGSRYLVPRPEGRVLVGSTEEHAGFQKQTTVAGVQGLLQLATRLVPDLASARVEQTWAGLRPGSKNGSPYLGRIGDFENLFVAAGHFRAGLQLSIGTAIVMADLLTGKTPAIDLEAFSPER